MTKPERLVLKHATGWFAAGWELGDAMMLLSDAGFKLFAWICLNADRHSGRIRLPVDEIARHLRREPGWVEAGWRELERSGLCRQVGDGWTEVSDRFWPYEKQARAGAGGYVEQVRRLLCAPACVRCRFTAADEKLARELERRGVTVAQIERAILLGCSRKYASMLANPAAWTPIASLSYFTSIIDEVCRAGELLGLCRPHGGRDGASLVEQSPGSPGTRRHSQALTGRRSGGGPHRRNSAPVDRNAGPVDRNRIHQTR